MAIRMHQEPYLEGNIMFPAQSHNIHAGHEGMQVDLRVIQLILRLEDVISPDKRPEFT